MTNGSLDLIQLIKDEFNKRGITKDDVMLIPNGCFGMCQVGPAMLIIHEALGMVRYIHITKEDIPEIIEKTLIGGEIIKRLFIKEYRRED